MPNLISNHGKYAESTKAKKIIASRHYELFFSRGKAGSGDIFTSHAKVSPATQILPSLSVCWHERLLILFEQFNFEELLNCLL
jgi:hypothetical protein